jgi:hypothetical protein
MYDDARTCKPQTEQTLCIIRAVLQTPHCIACGPAFVQSITRGVVTAKGTPIPNYREVSTIG